MKILEYPRPVGDTGIGFHWFPDIYHYYETQFDILIPRLKALGASWLTILSEPDKPMPEFFIRGLIEHGIEPVIRVYTPAVRLLDQAALRQLCQTYARWGAHYIHVYNEPNLEGEWEHWNPADLPQRFINYLLPCLETMYAIDGIVPVLTPLAPGGNYRDIEFFRIMLDQIIAHSKSYLFSKMAVGIHNYTLNHPLDWGKGGHAAWPCAEPFSTPPGCQDSNGFRQFEWYDELIRERAGFSLPLICGENGALPGSHEDKNYLPIDTVLHAQRHAEMARLLMENEVPYYVFNNAFWILSAPDNSTFADHRWFKDNGDPLLVSSIQALESLPKHPRELVPTFKLPDKIRLLMPDGTVQTLPLEEYLRGVVPAEIPSGSPLEALKAQAIAARSYAVSRPRHARQGADVCTTTHCQCWTPKHYPRTDQAVRETNGMIATYRESIIRAFYFGGCDGYTRNSEDVWVERLPYCRAVPCIAPLPEKRGHGVGLCQTGAIAMAEQGATASDILRHYYTGCQVREADTDIPPELRQGIIRGTVRNENGQVIPNVCVILRRGIWNAQTTTNLEGQYQFTGLTPGTYTAEIADRQGKRPEIQMDGRQTVVIDFVLSSASGWTMDVSRQEGLRLLIGRLPRAGIDVTIRNAWGHSVTVTSGSKPEYGPGAFEIPIWTEGLYAIRFLDQTFKIEIGDETVTATFNETGSAPPDTRLVSDWQSLAPARELLRQLQQTVEFSAWFSLEQRDTPNAAPQTSGWEIQIDRQPGLRLIIGRLPQPSIPVVISDPWGNETLLLSGSKPEYGIGGFETPIWRDGTYTIRFYDQSFSVEIQDETLYVTCTTSETMQGRLISDWTPQITATQRLERLQENPTFRDIFRSETKPRA